VTEPDQVDAAAAAGAGFIVAPDTRAGVAARALAHGLAYYPGALTPTEVGAAWDLGAAAVKVFPARQVGPDYLRELHGPFRDIALLPTGGIGIEAAADFIAAGAIAVGVGGPLLGDAHDGGDLRALDERARRLLATVAAAKAPRPPDGHVPAPSAPSAPSGPCGASGP
jgi:2-dehydro-3-deoxyphosphogluconate aldolase / (4S)-4-hydroxy-2-oxoglutarate aldolase